MGLFTRGTQQIHGGDASSPMQCRFCGHALRATPGVALAYANEFGNVYQEQCARCGRNNQMSAAEIEALLPPQQRPRPLLSGERMAHVLKEIPSSMQGMDGFLGEQIRVRDFQTNGKKWIGVAADTTLFAPSLTVGTQVGGANHGVVLDATSVLRAGIWVELQVTLPPRGNSMAAPYVRLHDASGKILPMTPTCANPSCVLRFSITFKQFRDASRTLSKEAPTGTRPTVLMTCNRCGSSRVITDSTFDDLFSEA